MFVEILRQKFVGISPFRPVKLLQRDTGYSNDN
jgi:hypothetical protein